MHLLYFLGLQSLQHSSFFTLLLKTQLLLSFQEKHGFYQDESLPSNLKQLRGRQLGEAAELMHKQFVITGAGLASRNYLGNILIK